MGPPNAARVQGIWTFREPHGCGTGTERWDLAHAATRGGSYRNNSRFVLGAQGVLIVVLN